MRSSSTVPRLAAALLGTATLALGIVGTAAPALAAGPGTGDVTITYFGDRNGDGVYSTTPGANGETDELRTSTMYLQASNGQWYGTTEGADGRYVFTDIPAGPARVVLTQPNTYRSTAIFESPSLQTLPQGKSESFQGGIFQYADSTNETTFQGVGGQQAAFGTVQVPDNGQVQPAFGLTAYSTMALTSLESAPTTLAAGLASITTLNGANTYPNLEVESGRFLTWQDGGELFLTPSDIGIRVTPATGYEIASVTAASSISGAPLPLTTGAAGEYRLDTTLMPRNFDRADFTVLLRPAAPTTTTPAATEPGTTTPTTTTSTPTASTVPGSATTTPSASSNASGGLATTGADEAVFGWAFALGAIAIAAGLLLRRRA